MSRWTEEDAAIAQGRFQKSHSERFRALQRADRKSKANPCAVPESATGPQKRKNGAGLKPRSHEEDDLQMSFVDWGEQMLYRFPELKLGFHPANGGTRVFRTDQKGSRYSPEAQRLKKMGMRAGVPDYIIPVPRNGFTGLAIEFKSTDGKVRPEQKQYCDALAAEGWFVLRACRSLDEAIDVTTKYLTSTL